MAASTRLDPAVPIVRARPGGWPRNRHRHTPQHGARGKIQGGRGHCLPVAVECDRTAVDHDGTVSDQTTPIERERAAGESIGALNLERAVVGNGAADHGEIPWTVNAGRPERVALPPPLVPTFRDAPLVTVNSPLPLASVSASVPVLTSQVPELPHGNGMVLVPPQAFFRSTPALNTSPPTPVATIAFPSACKSNAPAGALLKM